MMAKYSKDILKLLRQHKFRLKERLGQHLLLDENILKKIVVPLALSPSDIVLEIGAGPGNLTVLLANSAAQQVVAIEKDRKFSRILEEVLSGYSNVKIIYDDFLKLDIEDILSQINGDTVKLAGNLPYYITTPILLKILNNHKLFKLAVFTMQLEVALRLCAVPSTKAYGSLSVITQLYAEPKIISVVPKEAFFPQPSVESAIVKLSFKGEPTIGDENLFLTLTRAAFSKRRKTLKNALSMSKEFKLYNAEEILELAGIEPKRRAETLSLQEFCRLSDVIYQRWKP